MEFVSRDTLLIASLSMNFSIWPIELWGYKLAKVGESKNRLQSRLEADTAQKAKLEEPRIRARTNAKFISSLDEATPTE